MTPEIARQLAVLVLVVAVGWVVGKRRWLGPEGPKVLSTAAFFVFVPALLFRTTARLDLSTLDAGLLAAFFVPVLAVGVAVYAAAKRRSALAAGPAVRGITVSFGNTVQLGIPLAAALFGEAGLALHLSLVSIHGLVLLGLFTVLVERDLGAARRAAGGAAASPLRTLGTTARSTIVHPVILPILAGYLWNATGAPIPGVVDRTLLLLGQAVVPLCLVLIGLSLAAYGLKGSLRSAIAITVLKVGLAPLLVWSIGRFGFGLAPLPLAALTVAAALPVGSNPLLFAQRYDALQAETTSAIVVSTLAFVVALPLWLAVLGPLR
jgi:malonate transporter